MRGLLIEPLKQTVLPVPLALAELPHELRHVMSVPKEDGIVSQLLAPGLVVFLHDKGVIMPGARFWGVEGSESIFAGSSVALGFDPLTAQFGDLDNLPFRIQWRERLVLEGLDERLRMVADQTGNLMPIVQRSPRFTEMPGEAPAEAVQANGADVRRVWTVYAKSGSWDLSEDGYRAIQYEIGPTGHKVVSDPVEAGDLDVLYALMQVDETDGDTRYQRDPRDDSSVVETWLLPPGSGSVS